MTNKKKKLNNKILKFYNLKILNAQKLNNLRSEFVFFFRIKAFDGSLRERESILEAILF